jgi:hypothetical protein
VLVEEDPKHLRPFDWLAKFVWKGLRPVDDLSKLACFAGTAVTLVANRATDRRPPASCHAALTRARPLCSLSHGDTKAASMSASFMVSRHVLARLAHDY